MDEENVRRTARPSSSKQLATLVKKQLKVDLKAPGPVILRTVLGPVFLVLYGLSYLSSYNANYNNDNTVIQAYSAVPAALFFPEPVIQKKNSIWTVDSGRIWLDGIDSVDLNSLANAFPQLNYTSPSEIKLTSSGNETEFKRACEAAPFGTLFAGIYVRAGSPAWDYGIFMNGTWVPDTVIDSSNTRFFASLDSGFPGIQSMVNNAILLLENAYTNQSLTNVPMIQAMPTMDRTFKLSWALLWLPGFYINVGVMFMLNFFITPLIVDQRKEVVRQFVLMGVRPFVYWAHYLVVFSLEMVVNALLYTVVFSVMKFQTLSSIVLVFINFFLLMIQFAAFIIVLPYYIKTETVAGLVPFLGWIFSCAIYVLVLMQEWGRPVRTILTVINPFWASLDFASLYFEYDWAGKNEGINFSNLAESGMLSCILGQVGGFVLYTLYSFYLHTPKRHKVKGTEQPFSKSDPDTSEEENLEPLPDNAEVVLHVDGLRKQFTTANGMCKKPTELKILKGLSLDICRGEVYGFLGHNGAGKTTAISILAGEIGYDGGVAEYNFREGKFKVGSGSDNIIRTRIGVCPQHDILFDDLTCREHLELFAELKGGIKIHSGQSEREAILEEVQRRLDDVKFTTDGDENNPVKTYSGGMKRKVSIAISLLGDPELVFMDEPTAGMDPYNRRQVWNMISEAKKGRSIILTTHFMDEADLLSDRIGILNKGKLVAQGTSLFLKHKFGAGYTLNYSCIESEAAAIRAKITTLVPSATLQSNQNNVNERTKTYFWALPHQTEHLFPKLLTSLHETGAKSVSVDLTTLEQVFLATGTESHEEEDEQHVAAEEEERIVVDEEKDAISHIWENPGVKRNVSMANQIKLVAIITAKQSRRSLESIFFNAMMPVLYLVAGFIAAYLLKGQNIVEPIPINFDTSVIFIEDYTAPNGTVFGIPSVPTGLFPETILFNSTVPGPSLDDYFYDYNIGGVLTNGTLMFNATMTQSLPFLQGLAANLSMAYAGKNASIRSDLVPLPYQKVDDFPLVPFLLPMFLGIGFMALAYLIIDVVFYKEYQLFSVFRLMGVSRLNVYLGIAFQTFVIVFVPFFITSIILAFALKTPLAGTGGRWLAFLMIMAGYCYAVLPFGMIFEPLFGTIQQAKNWFPFIFVAITVLPFVLFSVTLASVSDKNIAYVVGDLLCLLPPMAFQRGLQGILNLSEEFDDPQVTWADTWGWDARVWYCIVLLFLTGTMFWGLVIFQLRRAQIRSTGGSENGLAPTDMDVSAERDYALSNSEGINARDIVKNFTVTPDTATYKYRFLRLDYWVQRLFCYDPFRSEYTTKHAVKGVSFGIKPSELFVLLGPNGSGKTVTTKILTRDLVQDGGTVVLAGQEESKPNDYTQIYRDGLVSYCPQFDALFSNLTVREHLEAVAQLRGMSLLDPNTKAHLHSIETMLGLDIHSKKLSSYLSGGYKRKLCLGMALVGYPSLCFFDEISTGVDPGARHKLWSVLKPESGDIALPSILLTTHYMDEAQTLATRVGIMINGEMISTGTVSRLKEKHCNKNFLEVTFRQGYPSDIEERLISFFEKKGLHAMVLESLVGRVKLQFPIEDMASNTKNLAQLFSLVESIKDEMYIEFYSVSLMNLEQIFIELSKKQFLLDQGLADLSEVSPDVLLGTVQNK